MRNSELSRVLIRASRAQSIVVTMEEAMETAEVAEPREVFEAEMLRARARTRPGTGETFRPEPHETAVAHPVVLGFFLLVSQHVIGFLDLLERLLGLLVVRISVGMILLGQLAVGRFYLVGRCVF